MSILTNDEKSEVESIISELDRRVELSDLSHAYERYFRRMQTEGNIDLLRVYQQLFMTADKDDYFSIERAQEYVVRHLNRSASGFLTKEMLELEQRVDTTTFDSAIAGPLCAYAFEHMEQSESFLYLVENRGFTDTDEIAEMLHSVDFASHHSALKNGII